MFTGQGGQYINMAKGLYQHLPGFRITMDEGADFLNPLLGMDIREVLFPSKGKEAVAFDRLNRTDVTQPVMFLMEYSLAKLFIDLGVSK